MVQDQPVVVVCWLVAADANHREHGERTVAECKVHIVTVLTVAQSAYLLAQAEGVLTSAMDMVSLKAPNTGYLIHECLAQCLPLLSTQSIIPFIPRALGGGHGPATSQELKKVLIKIYCIKKCLLDLDPI